MHMFDRQNRPLLVDCADKYGNIKTIIKAMKNNPNIKIGWKIECRKPGLTAIMKDLRAFVDTLTAEAIPLTRVFRILLHNYHNNGDVIYSQFEQAVDEIFGANVMPIGICNISEEQLLLLLSTVVRINYVQNEYHPFLETNVPFVCKAYNIAFEAHSALTNLVDYPLLLQNRSSLPQPAAQLAIAYASNAMQATPSPPYHPLHSTSVPVVVPETVGGGVSLLSVCFTTTNFTHLREILTTREIPPDCLAAMRQLSSTARVVRFVR